MDADEPQEQEKDKPKPGPLSEKVEWLIRHMWPADQPPAESDREVAKVISEATGESLSYSLIWKLRTGRAGNPTFKVLTSLAKFFNVPIGYFGEGESAESVQDQLDVRALMKEMGLGRASLRKMANLSPQGRESVADMIETVARREQRRAEGSTAVAEEG